jgi:PilZ domain
MQKFTYRAPRHRVDLPVRLETAGGTVFGRCREISAEGLRLELNQPLPADQEGRVLLTHRNVDLDLRVKVAYSGTHDGLKFIFESEKQRAEVARFIASLVDPANPSGPVLVR